MDTIGIKKLRRSFIKPAARVSGSPITGTQLRRSDHLPYFVYQLLAFSSLSAFKGNHLRFSNLEASFPKNQLNNEPSTLPAVAKKLVKKQSVYLEQQAQLERLLTVQEK
jgi:hypothetical protein